jgi:hypothetical protein
MVAAHGELSHPMPDPSGLKTDGTRRRLTDASASRPARIRVWALCTVATALLVAIGGAIPVALACLALAGIAASALAAPRRGTFVGALPAGFVVLCAWCLLWGVGAGLLGLDAWGSRAAAIAGLSGFVAITWIAVRIRGGSVAIMGRDLTAMAGALTLFVFFGGIVTAQPFAVWSRITGSGTDFLRHVGAIRDVAREGHLIPGEAGYPQAFHALASLLVQSTGSPLDSQRIWTAIAPVCFLMLGLVMLGLMVVATRVTDSLVGERWPGVVAGALTGVAFVQTAWFSSFLSFGHVMNMMVGVCLVALLSFGLQERTIGHLAGSVVGAGAIAVSANAWQLLLPVTCVAGIPWMVASLRRRRHHPADWVAWLVGGLLTVNGLLGLRHIEAGQQVSLATVSNLFRPDWWWAAALGGAMVACAWSLRRGLTLWSWTALGMVASGVGLVAVLMRVTGSTWELMLYYPVKALWTWIIVLIPLASAALVATVAAAWRSSRTQQSVVGTLTRGATILVLGVAIAGSVGRGCAFPPHLLTMADGRAGMTNWPLALIDAMKQVPVPEGAERGAIVFGLVPSASVRSVTGGFVGTVDYMAMEALEHTGIQGAQDAPVKAGLYQRDMAQVCRYLRDYPDSLRLTGPNPMAGAPWIVDSGCPEDVVRPERWISLRIDPIWFGGTAWEGAEYRYPTFSEVRAATGPRG